MLVVAKIFPGAMCKKVGGSLLKDDNVRLEVFAESGQVGLVEEESQGNHSQSERKGCPSEWYFGGHVLMIPEASEVLHIVTDGGFTRSGFRRIVRMLCE